MYSLLTHLVHINAANEAVSEVGADVERPSDCAPAQRYDHLLAVANGCIPAPWNLDRTIVKDANMTISRSSGKAIFC